MSDNRIEKQFLTDTGNNIRLNQKSDPFVVRN